MAFTVPTIDAAGQSAGFASNVAAVHAFCSVVRREGNCLGRSTLTLVIFASLPTDPAGKDSFASRLAPFALLVFPEVETAKDGLNARLLQPPTANALDTSAIAFSEPETRAVICCPAQFVGLNMKPGRSISTVTRCKRNGTPIENLRNRIRPRFIGRDRQRRVYRIHIDPRPDDHQTEVERSRDRTRDDAQPERRTTIRPRQIHGPFDFKGVGASAGGDPRRPDLRRFRAHTRIGAGSSHSGTLESIPNSPGGVWTWMPLTNCSRS